MIILLMFGSAIALFASVMFINQRTTRILGTVIFGVLFVGSTALMSLNYSHHFGMHQVTRTTTQKVYSAAGNLPVAIYQPVGTNGRDDVLIYKTSQDQKKPQHTQANEYTTSKMKFTNRSNAVLKTTETRWRFKNNFYKSLYLWSGMDGTLVKRTNVIEYPKVYVKVTTDQAKQLQKSASSNSGQMQSQMKAYVSAQVQAAMVKNPKMSAQQIQQVSQQAEQKLMAQMIRTNIKSAQ